MGRGKSGLSSAGGGGAMASPESRLNGSTAQRSSAERIYDIPPTGAFPSSQRIVNQIPSLKAMQEELNSAPIGTTVAFNMPRRGDAVTVRFFEKVSEKVWAHTDVTQDGDRTRTSGPTTKAQGIKNLQVFSSAHYNGEARLTSAMIDAYKNKY